MWLVVIKSYSATKIKRPIGAFYFCAESAGRGNPSTPSGRVPSIGGVFLFIKTGRVPPLLPHEVTSMYNKIPKFRQFHPAYIQSPKSRCQFSGYLASVSKKPTTITWKMKGVFKRCFGWNKFCVRYCNQYCRNNKHTGFDGLV